MNQNDEYLTFNGLVIPDSVDIESHIPTDSLVNFKKSDYICADGNEKFTLVWINRISPLRLYLDISISQFREVFFDTIKE